MSTDFSGKKVLVTGGARGIGFALSSAFLNAGADVYVTGRSTSRPVGLHKKINYRQLDFSDKNSVDIFLQFIKSHGSFDILVNNAGVNIINELSDIRFEDFELVNTVNLKGPFWISVKVAKYMNENGRILMMSSMWSVITKKGRISYSAAKAGLVGLTRSLAVELADKNILVNALSPGFVDTDLTKNSLSDAEIELLTSQVPLGRLAKPEEIAESVLFLCGAQNTFITGQNIVIDGGFSCV